MSRSQKGRGWGFPKPFMYSVSGDQSAGRPMAPSPRSTRDLAQPSPRPSGRVIRFHLLSCLVHPSKPNLNVQVGQDANSAMLKQALSGCGVDLSHLREVAGPCGTALILLQSSGE